MEPHYNVPVVKLIYVFYDSVIVEYGQVATRSARAHPMERIHALRGPAHER